jgi:phosphopantothenoylcysteine decarboxylase/phosphopantothenate--cysteine ligase
MLRNRNILLGITGGIAAYKACELARLLLKAGASVQVLMTHAATQFVGPISFEALTGRKVALDMFASEEIGRGHLDLVRNADLMVVAPATADMIGKLASGLADEVISTSVLALQCPLLVCPAMNPHMWAHPAVQANVRTLAERGVLILEPEHGAMAHPSEDPGVGRLPEPSAIFDRICSILTPLGPLRGVTIAITAGPTREFLDPIRFLSNQSSGWMGYALAAEARRRGAEVFLVAGPSSLTAPPGVKIITVVDTAQMLTTVREHLPDSQVLVMAAAPSDFMLQHVHPQKIKKEKTGEVFSLELKRTTDILKKLASEKGDRVFVGFALETDNGVENARHKLKEKKLDLIVLNHPRPAADVGIGSPAIQGTLISADGSEQSLPAIPKEQMAGIILDRVQDLLTTRSTTLTRV